MTMDDDLQHPPAEIPEAIGQARRGLGRRLWHSDKTCRTRGGGIFTSSFTKRAFALATGNHNIKAINAFRAFRTHLRQAFADFRSPQLQIDVLLSWGTSRFTTTPVRQEPRKIGRSNYTFLKAVQPHAVAVDRLQHGALAIGELGRIRVYVPGFMVLVVRDRPAR